MPSFTSSNVSLQLLRTRVVSHRGRDMPMAIGSQLSLKEDILFTSEKRGRGRGVEPMRRIYIPRQVPLEYSVGAQVLPLSCTGVGAHRLSNNLLHHRTPVPKPVAGENDVSALFLHVAGIA